MQTKPNNQTQPPHPKGATSRLRRLIALALTLLLGTAGLFNSAGVAWAATTGTTISAGTSFTCAIVNGGAKCWGINDYGQLGDGTFTQRNTPVDVSGLTSGVIAISAGQQHACAVTSDGAVKCWGRNSYGALGTGNRTDSTTPVQVTGLTSGFVAVASGYYHTCALSSAGGVKCWGTNFFSQLGDGTTTDRLTPVDVVGLTSGVTTLSSVYFHNCVITTSGGMKCWGYNEAGEVGDGTQTPRSTPVDVVGLTSGVVSIGTGRQFTCAATSNGEVKCWGANYHGQRGDGTISTPPQLVPLTVAITGKAVYVDAGESGVCAVKDDGTAQCWGGADFGSVSALFGLGNSNASYRTSPTDVVGGGFITIDVGTDHSCATTTTGMKCTGLGAKGALGNGETYDWYAYGGVSGLGSTGAGVTSTDLSIAKSASVSSATTGTPFDYTLTVTNNGPNDATNVVASDVLPAGFTFNSASATGGGNCSESGGTVTCTWATLADGANVTATINVTP